MRCLGDILYSLLSRTYFNPHWNLRKWNLNKTPTILYKDKTLESIIVFVSWKVRRNCANSCSNYSSKKRPEKNYSAGFGGYCCIPDCTSTFYTKCIGKRVKIEISLFKFPKDNTVKMRRINVSSVYQRKGVGGNFSPYDESKNYFFCEHHFIADDIHVILGIDRKTLKPGVKPSIITLRKKICLLATNPLTAIITL